MWPHVSRFVLRARQRAIQGLKALEDAQAHSNDVGHQMRRLRRKANLLVLLNWLTLENLGVTEGVVHSKTSNSRRWAVSSVEAHPATLCWWVTPRDSLFPSAAKRKAWIPGFYLMRDRSSRARSMAVS